MNVISKAKTMRKELFASYRNISGEDIMIPFRQLLLDLVKNQKTITTNKPLNNNLEILIAQCKIFESLLIKYFKSEENFQEMLVRKNDNKRNK